MAGAGLLFRNVGPETKALGFSNAINFPALWTSGQDDELVIDNQGFWFGRSSDGWLNTERRRCFIRRKSKIAADAACGCLLVKTAIPSLEFVNGRQESGDCWRDRAGGKCRTAALRPGRRLQRCSAITPQAARALRRPPRVDRPDRSDAMHASRNRIAEYNSSRLCRAL